MLDYAKLCPVMLNYAQLCFMPKLCQLCPLARGAAGGAQPKATLVRVSGPITRGQKNALTTMSTIRSPDLMLLVVVRGTVRTTVRVPLLAVLPLCTSQFHSEARAADF